jgi:PAS domain S-box-containing protein
MVVLDQERVDAIKKHLRWNPRGLTISDLNTKLNMNRNLLAKYLDMLLISGQVEMKVTGTAKVYFLSQRVPVSAMLEFSSDFIVMLDAEQRIIQVNEPVLRLLNEKKESLLGKKRHEPGNPFFGSLPLPEPVKNGETAQEKITETSSVINGKARHFRVKMVPTAFEDGSRGTTFIVEDITEKKEAEARITRYIRNLEFLARSSARFADMGDDEDIYRYIADSISELEPKAHVSVMSINPEANTTSMQAFAGNSEIIEMLLKHFGSLVSSPISLEKSPEAFDAFAQGVLIPLDFSLYVQTYRMYPEDLCNEIEERIALKKAYTMGCTCRKGIYGNISVRFQHDDDLTNRETVEAFIRQAGVALQRRHLREKLRIAEERIRVQEGMVPSPAFTGPVAHSTENSESETRNLSDGTP